MKNIKKRARRIISILVLTVMVLTLGIPISAQAATVNDIEGHWANKTISSWLQEGLITGYADGSLKPDNSITRAEFATLVNRVFSFSEVSPISFSDVKQADWFYNEIAKAQKAGYLSGYQDGTIKPNKLISREEVATIIAKLQGLSPDLDAANSFTDAASFSNWSKGFIGAVVKGNFMKGYPDGSFMSAKNITRAEAVVALQGIIDVMVAVKIEAIKDQTTTVNATVTAAVKVDPTAAAISIKNSDDKLVQATLTGASLALKGLKEGTATITVTATKAGMKNGVVTFKVVVGKEVVISIGGGGTVTPPVTPPVVTEDDSKLTSVEAKGTEGGTSVTGNYASDVTKVEIIFGSETKTAVLSSGSFHWNIWPALTAGTDVTVKGYVGTILKDTDVVKVGVEIVVEMLSDVQVVGELTLSSVTGKYANDVTKVEVLYKGLTKEAELDNGAFSWSIYPVLVSGEQVIVKAYIGTQLVKTVTLVVVGDVIPATHLISNVTAIGNVVATSVTGAYVASVTKVEVLYGSLTKEAELTNGTFSWSIWGGLASGTQVTIKAYVGIELKETVIVNVQ